MGEGKAVEERAQDEGKHVHINDWRTRASPLYTPISKDTYGVSTPFYYNWNMCYSCGSSRACPQEYCKEGHQ